MSRKTITQKISRAKSRERKKELFLEWVMDWEREQSIIIKRAQDCAQNFEINDTGTALRGLQAVTEKKFDAL